MRHCRLTSQGPLLRLCAGATWTVAGSTEPSAVQMAAGRLEATMLAAGLSIQAAPVPKSWAQPPAHGLSPGSDDPDGEAGSSGEEEAGDSMQELRKREPQFACCVANHSCWRAWRLGSRSAHASIA